MASTTRPEWRATSEATQQRLEQWARERGLSYQPSGLFPPVSDALRGGLGIDNLDRPGRFTESICSGTLPGGLPGALAHHGHLSYWNEAWNVVGETVVLARAPEALRLTRVLEGGDRATRPTQIHLNEPDYGRVLKDVDLVPAVRDRFWWSIHTEEDERVVGGIAHAGLAEALRNAPPGTQITPSPPATSSGSPRARPGWAGRSPLRTRTLPWRPIERLPGETPAAAGEGGGRAPCSRCCCSSWGCRSWRWGSRSAGRRPA